MYLFAAKVVADKQGAVLGKYLKSGDHNGRPYYVKTAEKNKKYYLQYQLNGIDLTRCIYIFFNYPKVLLLG